MPQSSLATGRFEQPKTRLRAELSLDVQIAFEIPAPLGISTLLPVPSNRRGWPNEVRSILHDDRRIEEFDGGIDMEFLANHRGDALGHERAGGGFIVPQIDAAGGPAVFRTQELFPDQAGHV